MKVLADATVDPLSDAQAMPYRPMGFVLRSYSMPMWRVNVTGKPPHFGHRVYYLEAKSDYQAAFAGIELFVKEMERPTSLKVN